MEINLDNFGVYDGSLQQNIKKALTTDLVIFLFLFLFFFGYGFGMLYLFKIFGLW